MMHAMPNGQAFVGMFQILATYRFLFKIYRFSIGKNSARRIFKGVFQRF